MEEAYGTGYIHALKWVCDMDHNQLVKLNKELTKHCSSRKKA